MKAVMIDPLRIAMTYKGVYHKHQISKAEYNNLLLNLIAESPEQETKDKINTLLAEIKVISA